MARVLVVEDDEATRGELERILRKGNHQVLLAGSGPLAMLVARDKKPDVVLTDIDMPKVNGIELCRQLRADPATADSWIVLLTALERGNLRTAGMEAGGDDFVHKPVDMDDLLGRVETGCRSHTMRVELAQARAEAEMLQATQNALVAALDAGVRGIEEAAQSLEGGDPAAALAALGRSHEELKSLLGGVELPGPGA